MAVFRTLMEVEAIQFTQELALEWLQSLGSGRAMPFGIHVSGGWHPATGTVNYAYVTLSQNPNDKVEIGDWIVRFPDGHLARYTPEAFAEMCPSHKQAA